MVRARTAQARAVRRVAMAAQAARKEAAAQAARNKEAAARVVRREAMAEQVVKSRKGADAAQHWDCDCVNEGEPEHQRSRENLRNDRHRLSSPERVPSSQSLPSL